MHRNVSKTTINGSVNYGEEQSRVVKSLGLGPGETGAESLFCYESLSKDSNFCDLQFSGMQNNNTSFDY